MDFSSPFPKLPKQNKNRLMVRILFKSVVYSFAVFGILFILLLFAILGLVKSETKGGPSQMPAEFALNINLNKSYGETKNDSLIAQLQGEQNNTLLDLLKAIGAAKSDDRVKALRAEISDSNLGLAQINAIANAVKDFKKSGKKTYIYARGFGSFGGGTSEYYLASVFDEVWMQPTTEAGITGISIEVPFIRGLLDKLGITPEFYSRHEYKNAYASMTETKMSKEFKSELDKLGGGILGYMVSDISQNRGIEVKDINSLISKAPLSAQNSLDAKLIDKIGYFQDMDKAIGYPSFAFEDYVQNVVNKVSGKKIAVLALEGVIDNSTSNSMSGEAFIGVEDTIKQLKLIKKEKGLKALVIRVNSPGGSHSASNEIWNAIIDFKKEANVPVIFSFGDYAASGGYYIAMAGDYILAEPLTVTGSIGVLGGKFSATQLWNKLDINWEEVNYGQNAGILSTNRSFNEREKAIFNKSLDLVYEDFTNKVSVARNIDAKKLDTLARGRIWLGIDAKTNGLIDEIGGINQALDSAVKYAKLSSDDNISIVQYPKAKTFQEKLKEALGSGPQIKVKQLVSELGLDINSLSVLKSMQYDLMALPVVIKD